MSSRHAACVAACCAALAVAGCDKAPAPKPPAPKVAQQEQVPPYTYPAPVKGHYKEINLGEFDVVDGIAYPAANGTGTVVYVTEKQIASPMIAGSACPMTLARALTRLRDSRYLEVTLDKGVSKYYAAGSAFKGSSYETEVGGHYWMSRLKPSDERALGSVTHRQHGTFDFDLPRSSPTIRQISFGETDKGLRGDPAAPKPDEQRVTAAYVAVHDAALKKNAKALLAALGFDDKQALAIRGLPGIDSDVAVYSERFLLPGTAGEFSAKAGTAHLRVEGTNAKGKKFVNYYYFTPCGHNLVLDFIAENPQ